MSLSLPLFYFKPTICWIDDDQILLDAINITFKKYYNCMTFNHPNVAMDFFTSYQSPLSHITFKRDFTESDIFGTNNHYPVDINIPRIKDLLDLPIKSQEIAVLVVDYNMPNLTGIDICNKLKSLPVKKILLTGEATHEIAIEAFNLGLIDKFINKSNNHSDELHQYVNELAYQYFCDRTSHLISHMEASKPSIFTDPIFISFFKGWCQENYIEEFYLINKQGSFLVKDKNNRLYYFVAYSESDKNEFLYLNEELFITEDFLFKSISEGKLIPFFGAGKESWNVDTHNWSKYFHPSQIISGRENYYWSTVNK